MRRRHVWEVIKGDVETHVLPIGDLMTHTYTVDCACRPRRDETVAVVIIHNSRDGRERYETTWAEKC